jgi:hypothetical protein
MIESHLHPFAFLKAILSLQFLLANCAVMLAGCGSHVAASSLDGISVCTRDDEINPTYSILYQATTWYKTSIEATKHRIFPHRNQMELCFYFVLAYALLIMDDGIANECHLFPLFSKLMFQEDSSKVESKVSSKINDGIEEIWNS